MNIFWIRRDDCHDLMSENNVLLGWVGPIADGARGYVVERVPRSVARMKAMCDRPTIQEAKDWVEIEARRALPPSEKGDGHE